MCLTSVATVTTAVFNLIIESKVILILFYYLANQIFVPIILGQISKQFSIPNNLLDVLKKINLRCIFWGVVWDLGVRVCMPRCALIHHLLAYLDIRNINYQIIISPVKMVHMVENTIFWPSHQSPFHGKECPGKNMLSIGWGVHDIVNSRVDEYVQGWIPRIKLITLVVYILCSDPPLSRHKLTQFRSKIFRRVHLCSSVHAPERSKDL